MNWRLMLPIFALFLLVRGGTKLAVHAQSSTSWTSFRTSTTLNQWTWLWRTTFDVCCRSGFDEEATADVVNNLTLCPVEWSNRLKINRWWNRYFKSWVSSSICDDAFGRYGVTYAYHRSSAVDKRWGSEQPLWVNFTADKNPTIETSSGRWYHITDR